MTSFAKALFSNGYALAVNLRDRLETVKEVVFSTDYGDEATTDIAPPTMAQVIGERLVSKAVERRTFVHDDERTLRLCTVCLEPIPHDREVCVCRVIR